LHNALGLPAAHAPTGLINALVTAVPEPPPLQSAEGRGRRAGFNYFASRAMPAGSPLPSNITNSDFSINSVVAPPPSSQLKRV
jgi:hypothetical protein